MFQKQRREPEIITGNTAEKAGLKAWRGRLRAGIGVSFVSVFENGSGLPLENTSLHCWYCLRAGKTCAGKVSAVTCSTAEQKYELNDLPA